MVIAGIICGNTLVSCVRLSLILSGLGPGVVVVQRCKLLQVRVRVSLVTLMLKTIIMSNFASNFLLKKPTLVKFWRHLAHRDPSYRDSSPINNLGSHINKVLSESQKMF